MLSLKSICLLKVFQLDLPDDGIPKTLAVELEKMKIFNGNFSGSHGEVESYSKATVLTIQYLGDKSWAFQMNYTTLAGGPEELFEFVIEEDKPLKTGFSICRGLSSFGLCGWARGSDKEPVSTVLTVDKGRPGKLDFKTTKKMPRGYKCLFFNKFQIYGDLDSPRCLSHGLKFGDWSGSQWLGSGEMFTDMVECAAAAKDAFSGRPEIVTRGEFQDNGDSDEEIEVEEENDAESGQETEEDPEDNVDQDYTSE